MPPFDRPNDTDLDRFREHLSVSLSDRAIIAHDYKVMPAAGILARLLVPNLVPRLYCPLWPLCICRMHLDRTDNVCQDLFACATREMGTRLERVGVDKVDLVLAPGRVIRQPKPSAQEPFHLLAPTCDDRYILEVGEIYI